MRYVVEAQKIFRKLCAKPNVIDDVVIVISIIIYVHKYVNNTCNIALLSYIISTSKYMCIYVCICNELKRIWPSSWH